MSPEKLFNELMESLFRRTGVATGYWPNYFSREVRKKGGVAVAKRLLNPKIKVSDGFDKLVAVRRADLSVEFIAVQPPFRSLFSTEELAEAQRRLDLLPKSAFPDPRPEIERYPDEVSDAEYHEGARLNVTVNRYERNQKAHDACVKFHGARCCVCDVNFRERYGDIGKDFIHVHHLKPISQVGHSYKVDPRRDLVPICPNCHAMLHRQDPPLDPEELRARLTLRAAQK